ncbi:hypothetical protein NIIDMKKI_36500 [Mycobacterium kansasii]|uniref:Uncharacterized protein n=1 Tax=Mycobacterium kansasii TaxID=1768 RepID=A0A7G1IDD1_MYCKA|nr:hypothetical protein NIIDMKKI_36500 [Mycobacterium kansasii]
MRPWKRPAAVLATAVLAFTAVPEVFAIMAPSAQANADVCVNAGRRVSVSGCANIADAVAPTFRPRLNTPRCRKTIRLPAAGTKHQRLRQCRPAHQRQRVCVTADLCRAIGA